MRCFSFLCTFLLVGLAPPCPIVVDDADAARVEITAYWRSVPAREVLAPHGTTVLSDDGTGADGVVRFQPEIDAAGTYDVDLYWPSLRDSVKRLATNVPVTIRHADGRATLTVDQRATPQTWTRLGTFRFTPDEKAYVEIRNDRADGIVLADAVRFRPAER